MIFDFVAVMIQHTELIHKLIEMRWLYYLEFQTFILFSFKYNVVY